MEQANLANYFRESAVIDTDYERTNFDLVVRWMEGVGQLPDKKVLDTLGLRLALIHEEAKEAEEAGEAFGINPSTETLANYLKELGDVLVVTYGAIAAAGFNGDEVFGTVMHENEEKVQHREVREDGKIVVNPKVKAALKKQTKERLNDLVEQVHGKDCWKNGGQ